MVYSYISFCCKLHILLKSKLNENAQIRYFLICLFIIKHNLQVSSVINTVWQLYHSTHLPCVHNENLFLQSNRFHVGYITINKITVMTALSTKSPNITSIFYVRYFAKIASLIPVSNIYNTMVVR